MMLRYGFSVLSSVGVGLLKIILTVTCKVPLMIRYCPVYSQITVPHSWR